MARGIDTYAPPNRIIPDNSKEMLGKALQAFGARLGSMGKVDKQNDPRLAEIHNIRASADDPTFVRLFNEGKLPYQDVPHIKALADNLAGEATARSVLNDIQLGIKDGTLPLTDEEGRPVDVNRYIQSSAAKYKLVPSTPFMKAYANGIDNARVALVETQRGKIAEINRETIQTLAKSSIDNVIRQAHQGAGDDDLRNTIRQTTQDARKYGGLRPAEMDDLWIGRIREIAEQDPDTAERLLVLDRGKGHDGQPIGSLSANPRHRDSVREIAKIINEARTKRFDNAEKEKAIADGLARLRAGDGSFMAITGYTYTNPFAAKDPNKDPNKTISKDTIQTEALLRYQQESDAQLRAQGSDPDKSPVAAKTQFERDYGTYVGSNQPNPRWRAALTHAGRVLTNPQALSQPNNQQQVVRAAQLYWTLHARNPGYLEQTLGISEREQKFYTQMRAYQDLLGDPPEIAARKAAEYVNNPPPPLDGEARKALDSALPEMSWFVFKGYNNVAAARKMVVDTAMAIAADTRIEPKEAVKLAEKIVEERAIAFNGQILPPHGFINRENLPAFQRRLDEIYKDNEQLLRSYGISSSKDLSIRPVDNERFMIVRKDGAPLVLPGKIDPKTGAFSDYSFLHIHATDINNIRAQMRKELEDNTITGQERRQKRGGKSAPHEMLRDTFGIPNIFGSE